jgi:hypothetical protein
MTLNIGNPSPVMINDQILPHTESFTYLESIVTNEGGAENDIKQRLTKARIAFKNLQAVWRSSQYTTMTKLKLYTSCILPTLSYGSECWRMTENDLDRLSIFHTKSLRRILKIFWPNTISNKDLLNRCQQEDMATIITKRRWKWIGHVLRKEPDDTTKIALYWTPEGKREDGQKSPGEEQWRQK